MCYFRMGLVLLLDNLKGRTDFSAVGNTLEKGS